MGLGSGWRGADGGGRDTYGAGVGGCGHACRGWRNITHVNITPAQTKRRVGSTSVSRRTERGGVWGRGALEGSGGRILGRPSRRHASVSCLPGIFFLATIEPTPTLPGTRQPFSDVHTALAAHRRRRICILQSPPSSIIPSEIAPRNSLSLHASSMLGAEKTQKITYRPRIRTGNCSLPFPAGQVRKKRIARKKERNCTMDAAALHEAPVMVCSVPKPRVAT